MITQLAIQVGTDRITIDATRSNAVFVNGMAQVLSASGSIDLSGGQISELADGSYQLTWNSGEALSANIIGRHIDIAFGLGAGDAPGTVLGLLGRNDNTATNYVLPDGTMLPDTLTADQLYNMLGNAWRVTDATSLFDYEDGKTTASYTDTSFPRLQLSLSDLPAAVVGKAKAAALAAGVTDPNAMLVGEQDYILTGDLSYLVGAQSAIGGLSLTAATITPSAPTPVVLGLFADTTMVVTAADGSASAVFDVYLTKPSSTDTVVDYTVVLAASGDLDPAAFGTAPTTGSITIAAGQTTGQITIAVPAGALGSTSSQNLALRISSADVLVYAPDALTQLVQPVAGPPPTVSISEQTTLGTLTHSGNTYSLDLGAISYGESLPLIRFALRNTAAAGADQLGGSFTVAPSYGYTVAGAGTLSPIAAGQNYSGLTVALNQNKFGANIETIAYNPTDTNPSGYSVLLDPVTLNVSYTLEAPTMAYSQAWGDVHIITYNNLKYDFQAVGEFVLAHSNIASDTFDIQLRLSPYAGSSSVSIITEVALQIGADRVTFELDRATTVWLNGVPSTVSAGAPALNLAGGTVSMLSDATFKVTWATGETATITNDGRYFNVIDGVPVAQFGQFSGLQGENEGQANDFQLADGTVLPQPLAASTLYGAYANAWRVSQATSLFDYAPGQTTDTYTDRSFPHAPVQLSDLPADVQARAMAAVAATGITDPGIAAAAALDYIATGDPTFIAAAAVAQQQAGGTTVATITPDLPAVPQIGINAQAASVVEAASGPTSVSFTVLLTHASATDTVVTYAVIAPDPSDLDAATFGGILPSGQVTIAAGQTTAALTIVVPQDSLGVDPTAGLEVQIGSTDGTPIFAANALTTITNARPEPGPPAVAQFLNLGAGSLTRSGDTFTLDLGMLSQGQLSPSINLAVANVAVAPADLMSGSFTPPLGSGFILIGNNLPAPIAAGAMYSGIYAQANTGALGAHSETLTFQPIDENSSGYQQNLSKLTLVITDDVVAAAAATLLTPSTIVFQNTRLGTAEDQAVSFANTGPAGGAALAVKPVANGNALTTGLVASLAAGAVDTSSIRVGLNTSSAGARGGSVTLQPTSLLAGSTVASADQPSIAVFGSVYRPASAVIVPITAVVHVGDAGALPLGISNADAADGYSEDLRATLTSVSGPFGATAGQSTGAIAAGAASSALAVSFSTAAAAQLTGSATVALLSDGGAVGTGVDGLGTLTLPSQTAQLSVTVDNYASASLQLLAGTGALASSGNNYTLDLGTVAQGSTPLTATLGAINAANGPADLLSGHFAASAANAIGLSGFGDFAGLGAGQTDGGLLVSLDTTGVGTFTRTLTLTSTGSNASGYSGALAPETLTITGTVAAPTVTPPTGPEPGTPAVAQFFNLGAGNLTRSGDTFTLDLGMLAQGQLSPGINLAVGNIAIAPADLVSGSFTPPLGSGFVLTGTNLPAPIAAGTTYSGIYAQADTATLGSHTETLTFQPIDENASGYQQNLSPLTLVITDNVAAVAAATLLTPSAVVFQNVRMGTVEDQAVSIANTNPVGGAALAIKPVASGNALATGFVASLAAGAVDASSIQVGLDTSSAGARGGSVTLQSTSLLAGTTVASADQPTIAVSGSVYRPAAAVVAPIATILHVGDVGLLSLGIFNADVADGFSEDLRATLTNASGPFGATAGQSTGAIAAGAASSALTVSFSTAAAAQLTGSATVALLSDGGAVGTGVDGLGTLALPSRTAQLSVTVDNYASASLQLLVGTGTLAVSGSNYTLDFGTVAKGAGPLAATLGAVNAASGPADLLSGHFVVSDANAIGLTGFRDFAGLEAGQTDGGLTVSLDTSEAGTFSRTFTLASTGSNASGYSAALAPEILTITGTVAAPTVTSPTPPGGGSTMSTGSQPGSSTPTVSTPVYRFFDTIYGTHLFTQSLSEAQNILANRPDLTEEINNFGAVNPQTDPNAEAVYRFFENTNGTHFFTASYKEYLGLTTPGSSTYRPDLTYEANSTFYEDSIQQTGEVAVYRFFDNVHGTQFLTGSQSEYTGLTTAGSSTYRPDLTPEGTAFYAPTGSFFA